MQDPWLGVLPVGPLLTLTFPSLFTGGTGTLPVLAQAGSLCSHLRVRGWGRKIKGGGRGLVARVFGLWKPPAPSPMYLIKQ
jgi:hypothetical protein